MELFGMMNPTGRNRPTSPQYPNSNSTFTPTCGGYNTSYHERTPLGNRTPTAVITNRGGNATLQGNIHINALTYNSHNQENIPFPGSVSMSRANKRVRGNDDFGDEYDLRQRGVAAMSPIQASAGARDSGLGIPTDVVLGLAQQCGLDEARQQLIFSFHRACSTLNDADGMTRLMSYAVQLQSLQAILSMSTSIQGLSSKLDVAVTTAKKTYEPSKAVLDRLDVLAKLSVIQDDRRVFSTIAADATTRLLAEAESLGITDVLTVKQHKTKITSLIKKRANTARSSLRRYVLSSTVASGPTRLTLDQFCLNVFERYDGVTPLPLKKAFIAQMARLRAYCLESQAKASGEPSIFDPDLDDDIEPDASEPVIPPTGKENDKEDDKITDTFWKAFEGFMKKNKAAHLATDGNFSPYVQRLVDNDNKHFNPPPVVSGSYEMSPFSNQGRGTQPAQSEALNSFLNHLS